jgi:predicted aspartyl protease
VNSLKTYQFVLDTGASQTVISPALAEQTFMRTMAGDSLIGAGGLVTGSSGMVKSLRIHGASVENVSVVISDAFAPLNQVVGVTIDGILGYDVLRAFRLIIDYPSGTLQFQKSR